MKVLALCVVLVAAFCTFSADAGRCFTRKEKKGIQSLMLEMTCEDPMEQLVKLNCPASKDYLVPSMAKVKRCSGLMCWGKNVGCVPTEEREKLVKVEAKMIDGSGVECTHIKVMEHLKCGCGCLTKPEDCKEKEEFDGMMCSCMCKEELKRSCETDYADGSMMFTSDCDCVAI